MSIKLYKTDNKLGFDYHGTFITDCFESECGRFLMNPIKDYGLTQKQVDEMVKVNGLEEDEEDEDSKDFKRIFPEADLGLE